MKASELIEELKNGNFDKELRRVYPDGVERERERIAALAERFIEEIGDKEGVGVFSAPGRTEIGGNHTDHQLGNVVAASVSLDTIAVAAPNGTKRVTVSSKGFKPCEIDLKKLTPDKKEANSANALIRGVCAGFAKRGYEVGGFDAVTVSDLPAGSGLSTSAAFEVLIGNIVNGFFALGEVDSTEIARIGQSAENDFFLKPCGLMDQLASSTGGCIAIDFFEPDNIVIKRFDFDLKENGFALCITNAGGSHADLTDEYAAITREMKSVSQFFGKRFLSRVDEKEFYSRIGELRDRVSDRAILRAIHFFNENKLARREFNALRENDISLFLELVTESGFSSYMYLQNIFPAEVTERSVSLGLALSERLLRGRGAWRVHGGGFAGTFQAFVPLDLVDKYVAEMEKVFGSGSCHNLSIRAVGGTQII